MYFIFLTLIISLSKSLEISLIKIKEESSSRRNLLENYISSRMRIHFQHFTSLFSFRKSQVRLDYCQVSSFEIVFLEKEDEVDPSSLKLYFQKDFSSFELPRVGIRILDDEGVKWRGETKRETRRIVADWKRESRPNCSRTSNN